MSPEPPTITQFTANNTSPTVGDIVEISGNIQAKDFTLHKWWFTYNDTVGGVANAASGTNTLTWDTSGLEGNYSVMGYVNDTEGYTGTSTQIWIDVVSTTTTTATTTTLPAESNSILNTKYGGLKIMPANSLLYLEMSNITMKRSDGQYVCCGPDNSNNWVCTSGPCA